MGSGRGPRGAFLGLSFWVGHLGIHVEAERKSNMRTALSSLLVVFVLVIGVGGVSLYRATVGIPGAPMIDLRGGDDVLSGNIDPANLPVLQAVAPTDSREAVGQAVANLLKGAAEGVKK